MGTEMGFHLRPVRPDDGQALIQLFESSPDTGAIGVRVRYLVDPYQLLMTGRDRSLGVVAETSGGGLVGACFVRFGRLRLEEQLYDSAYRPPRFQAAGPGQSVAWLVRGASPGGAPPECRPLRRHPVWEHCFVGYCPPLAAPADRPVQRRGRTNAQPPA
jgi:hypothetical protein